MRCVLQRVLDASVTVDDVTVGKIKQGILVYFGVQKGDDEERMRWICDKIVKLRMFKDNEDKMNLSLKDAGGDILLVSQFTLCANLHKGNRPSWDDSEDPALAEQMYLKAIAYLQGQGVHVEHGRFGAHMLVSYVNDGPVTFVLDH
jgi:D-tyrosyl-tRNA(Tyr) deacylase